MYVARLRAIPDADVEPAPDPKAKPKPTTIKFGMPLSLFRFFTYTYTRRAVENDLAIADANVKTPQCVLAISYLRTATLTSTLRIPAPSVPARTKDHVPDTRWTASAP